MSGGKQRLHVAALQPRLRRPALQGLLGDAQRFGVSFQAPQQVQAHLQEAEAALGQNPGDLILVTVLGTSLQDGLVELGEALVGSRPVSAVNEDVVDNPGARFGK